MHSAFTCTITLNIVAAFVTRQKASYKVLVASVNQSKTVFKIYLCNENNKSALIVQNHTFTCFNYHVETDLRRLLKVRNKTYL